jgi:hypothetical protein
MFLKALTLILAVRFEPSTVLFTEFDPGNGIRTPVKWIKRLPVNLNKIIRECFIGVFSG